MKQQPGEIKSIAVQAVFQDFITRLRAETKLSSVAINQVAHCLETGQYSVDKLRTALFTEEGI